MEVTVRGEVDPTTGFVIDLKELKEIMNREVVETLDHRHLNKEIAEFARRNPTTENHRRLHLAAARCRSLKIAKLHRVRVYESHDLFVDFLGEA